VLGQIRDEPFGSAACQHVRHARATPTEEKASGVAERTGSAPCAAGSFTVHALNPSGIRCRAGHAVDSSHLIPYALPPPDHPMSTLAWPRLNP
jgi:hypothetical protein